MENENKIITFENLIDQLHKQTFEDVIEEYKKGREEDSVLVECIENQVYDDEDLTNSNPDINIESALEFITEINKWAKNYNYHFQKRILIPFYEWEKIKKKSENNLKVELGNIIITKKLVEQMDNPDYREEIIKCISDYKHCRWGNPDEEKKQDNDWAVYYGADIRDLFETSHGKIEIMSLMDRSNTFIDFL